MSEQQDTGPVGLIGNTRKQAVMTAETLLRDLAPRGGNPEALVDRLRNSGRPLIGFEDWRRIDQAEQAQGREAGKEREKILTCAELLDAAQRSQA